VRVALVALHVVAAHRLGSGDVAVGAGRRVLRDVVVRCLFFDRQLGGIARVATLEIAMPGFVACTAEGEAAFEVFADGEAITGVKCRVGAVVVR
jgi:hypothetical protein